MQEEKSTPGALQVIRLDTRGMESPEPILAILKSAGEIGRDAILEVQIDTNPFQLYDLLQQRGFYYEANRLDDGTWLGVVRPREHPHHA